MTLSPEDLKYLEPEFQKLAWYIQEDDYLEAGGEAAPALLSALIAERKRVEELEKVLSEDLYRLGQRGIERVWLTKGRVD